jgi:hypothetical protein
LNGHERIQSSAKRIPLGDVQIDMISGITAGIVSNIISHPLDTIKVRMQLNKSSSLKIIPAV